MLNSLLCLKFSLKVTKFFLLNNELILTNQFWHMIYSQIIHQILFFSRENILKKDIFIFKNFNLSENKINSVELVQVLFSFFLKFVNLWGRWKDKPPEEDLAKFGYKPESKVELFWTPLDILAMVLEAGVKIWRIFFSPLKNMATLCHCFSKEILVRFKFSSLPPFVFWSPSDKISPKRKTLDHSAIYAGCFACPKTLETAVFVSQTRSRRSWNCRT